MVYGNFLLHFSLIENHNPPRRYLGKNRHCERNTIGQWVENSSSISGLGVQFFFLGRVVSSESERFFFTFENNKFTALTFLYHSVINSFWLKFILAKGFIWCFKIRKKWKYIFTAFTSSSAYQLPRVSLLKLSKNSV